MKDLKHPAKPLFQNESDVDLTKHSNEEFDEEDYHTCTKKFWSDAGLEPTSFCLTDLKNPQKIRNRSYNSVVVSGSHLIKLIKSVTSLDLKKKEKKKSPYYSLRFSTKSAD